MKEKEYNTYEVSGGERVASTVGTTYVRWWSFLVIGVILFHSHLAILKKKIKFNQLEKRTIPLSRIADAERREWRVEASIQRARGLLGFWGLVLKNYAQGLSDAQSAESLGVTPDKVWYARKKKLGLSGRCFLDSENGQP